MLTKISLLFDVTTAPTDRTAASAHSGGWSEGVYVNSQIPSTDARIAAWALKRATLLPQEVSIVGFRLQYVTLQTNKLVPGGTAAGKFLFPGTGGITVDQPQVGLELSGSTNAGPNTNRFVLRGLPDYVVQFGEYQPNGAYKGLVTNYRTFMTTNGFGFIGRDKSAFQQTIASVAGNLVQTTVGGIGPVGTYCRFVRCNDDAGNPIKGVYLATAVVAVGGNLQYTLQGLNATKTKPGGLLRADEIAFFLYNSIAVGRSVIKKIGRPFEVYRGRRSKSRV